VVCLFLSTVKHDPLSAAIRLATRCPYSHAGFFDTDTRQTFSAMLRGGVDWRKPTYTSLYLFGAPKMQEAFEWALTQRGKKYDWTAITGFAFNRDWREEDRWFCSELVCASFEKVGAPLLNPDMQVYRIAPRDILLSPFISA
jgi:hypothetical protein